MTDSTTRKRLYDEAFALLARAEIILDAMYAKYEQQVAQQNEQKKAA